MSNRGPVSYGRDVHGERTVSRGGGGLATALRGLVEQHDVTWILIAQDRDAYARFYNVIANPTLWFVQHMLWDLARTPDWDDARHDAWTNGYVPVNVQMAHATLTELDRDPSAAVFFHDYHLYLAPAFVRRERPDALLAHFVHIPWPESDAWTVLPPSIRRDVFAGLLANDVVGFHTQRWQRNFLRSCVDVLGAAVDGDVVQHDGRRTLVTSHPIGIDPAELDELKQDEDVLAREREIEAWRPETARPARTVTIRTAG